MNASVYNILSISFLSILVTGCATVQPMSKGEVEKAYSGNTVYYSDGEKEYMGADGTTIYDSKKGLRKGRWYSKEGKVCFKYDDKDKAHCSALNKKGEKLFYKKSISFKGGDSEDLLARYEKKLAEEKRKAEQKRIEREKIKKQKAAEEKRNAEEKAKMAREAKKLVGKKVKWTEYKNIDSDDCMTLLFKTICHSVKYRFKFTGTVSHVNANKEQYIVKLSHVKLIGQDYVAAMYWKYKVRAQNWAAQQAGRTRGIEYKYVSRI